MELKREEIVIEIQGIIKALKANNGWWENRGRGGWFNHDMLVDALALINELTEDLDATRAALNDANNDRKKLTEENERLRAENERFRDDMPPIGGFHSD